MLQSFPSWICLESLQRETSRRHPRQIPSHLWGVRICLLRRGPAAQKEICTLQSPKAKEIYVNPHKNREGLSKPGALCKNWVDFQNKLLNKCTACSSNFPWRSAWSFLHKANESGSCEIKGFALVREITLCGSIASKQLQSTITREQSKSWQQASPEETAIVLNTERDHQKTSAARRRFLTAACLHV